MLVNDISLIFSKMMVMRFNEQELIINMRFVCIVSFHLRFIFQIAALNRPICFIIFIRLDFWRILLWLLLFILVLFCDWPHIGNDVVLSESKIGLNLN